MARSTNCDNLEQMIHEGARDGKAVAALATCLGEDIRRYAQARCGCRRGDSDDISQDVLLAAQKYLSSFRGESSLRTWLYRLVLSACSRRRRGRKNNPALHKPIDDAAPLVVNRDPEIELLVSERLSALEHAVAELRPKDRELLSDVEWDRKSLAEAAEARQTTVSAIKSRLFRIRQQLRESVEKRVAPPAPDGAARLED